MTDEGHHHGDHATFFRYGRLRLISKLMFIACPGRSSNLTLEPTQTLLPVSSGYRLYQPYYIKANVCQQASSLAGTGS